MQSRFAKIRPKELSASASGSANNLVRGKNTDPRIWKQATAPSADVGATLGMRSNIVTVRDFFDCNRHNVFFKFSKMMKPSTIPVLCRAVPVKRFCPLGMSGDFAEIRRNSYFVILSDYKSLQAVFPK